MTRTFRALLSAGGAVVALGYKAAFVEHQVVSPCGSGSCGKQQNAASVKSYAEYAAQAASQGAQIIVFPEYGITGESSYDRSAWVDGGYTETIPQPTGSVPCNSANLVQDAPSIVALSCAAKQNKIAIVANLIDYNGKNGVGDGKIYNTDVAFDTDGTLLAKYHKQNLWGEGNIDVPDKCSESTFTTSFGVTFGMFTCADLIFKHPAVDMVKKGVKNFVVPVGWTNEMASLQAMPYAQSWSATHGVNIIVSNLRQADYGTGSGIWASGRTMASQYVPGDPTPQVIVADVPEADHPLQQRGRQLSSGSIGNGTRRLAVSAMGSASGWQFVELSVGKVCSGAVCCSANVGAGAAAGYALGALNGADGESGVSPFPAQVCAVLPCRSPGKGCLEHQAATGNLQNVQLSMTGVSAQSLVAEVLATSMPGTDEVLLAEGSTEDGFKFAHTGTTASLSVATTKKLGSALLYGRMFSKDRLPYSCDSTIVV